MEKLPERIGRYQIVEKIGLGAMGAVFKAFDPLIKRHLAIKTIRVDVEIGTEQYQSFLERFYNEARIAGTLSHPNIITIYDIGEESGMPFLAFEYIAGVPLSKLIEDATEFRHQDVIVMVAQIASALDYAHSKGVVHRDIKPSNVLVHNNNRIKVMDFGIGKFGDADLTKPGVLLGTPSYMSPEQSLGETVDGRSDLFSLATMAFELLTGKRPFPGDTVTAILYKIVHADPASVENLDDLGLLPERWTSVFQKALSKDREKRFQKGEDFVRALWDCQRETTQSFESFMQAALEPKRGVGLATAERTLVKPPKAAPTPPSLPPAPPPPPPPPGATVLLPREEPPDVITSQLQKQIGPSETPQQQVSNDTAPRVQATIAIGSPAADTGERPLGAGEEVQATVALDVPTMAQEHVDIPTVVQPPVRVPTPEIQQIPPMGPAAGPAERQVARAEQPQEMPTVAVDLMPTADQVPPAVIQPPAAPERRPASYSRLFVLAVVLVLLVGVGVLGYWVFSRQQPSPAPQPAPPPQTQPAQVQPQPATPVQPAVGTLELHTTPEGASVFVNGEMRGATPLTLSSLPFGTYNLRFELKGYDLAEETRDFAIGAGQNQVMQFALREQTQAETVGALKVTSDPAGATIMLDGKNAGVTPKVINKLRPGKHVLELSKQGYIKWVGQPAVRSGKQTDVAGKLEPVPPPPKPVIPAKPTAADDKGPFPLSPDIKFDRKLLTGDQPSKPKGAPKELSGSVLVKIFVNESGVVDRVDIQESGGAVLDKAVADAVLKWRYKPAVRNGKPVRIFFPYKFTFR
ncbi:MAG: TonB family protein [Acidobacteriota bacterium]